MYIDQKIRIDLIHSTLESSARPKREVLEVGCGNGELAMILADAGYDVYACDMPGPYVPPAVKHFVADGSRLPMPSDRFQWTISSEVLEHVPVARREAFLEELVRVTRPGGRIVLTAFVRRTFTFRLWGAAWLLANRKGGLPPWYCEHVSLPPPTTEEIRAKFASLSTRVLESSEYSGAGTLWFMWFQAATGWVWLTKYTSFFKLFANWGAKISCVVVAEKPGGSQ